MRLAGVAGKVVVVTIAIADCLGCATRPTGKIYQLSKLDADYFMLSPIASRSGGDRQLIRVARSSNAQVPVDPTTCSIQGSWFTFSSAPAESRYWIVQAPSLAEWQKMGGSVDMKEEWQKFEQSLDELRQKMCFVSPDEYLSVVRTIADSVSVPAADTLFYRYGYGPGGYIDLTPGMRLQIEREYYGPHANDQPSSTTFEGTTITVYEVSGDVESRTKMGFFHTEKRVAGPTSFATDASDGELAAHFKTSLRLRLFLANLVVSGNVKIPAVLIGALTDEDLRNATKEMEGDLGTSCSALLRWHITCARFDGTVTVSPMLPIIVNGSITYVPIGSKLWFVLPHTTEAKETDLIPRLRLQRLFGGKAVDVQFTRDAEGVSQVFLVGWDNVSWSKSANSNVRR